MLHQYPQSRDSVSVICGLCFLFVLRCVARNSALYRHQFFCESFGTSAAVSYIEQGFSWRRALRQIEKTTSTRVQQEGNSTNKVGFGCFGVCCELVRH